MPNALLISEKLPASFIRWVFIFAALFLLATPVWAQESGEQRSLNRRSHASSAGDIVSIARSEKIGSDRGKTAGTLVKLNQNGFQSPPPPSYPETWFHLIGGNVNQQALTTDLEAVAAAGIGGIHLFHGRGRPWPNVKPQIQTLSPTWDSLVSHVAHETQRLGLKFTMQNCPGWAMSGGPWITPDNAMRHLVSSRVNIAGGQSVSLDLDLPQPSTESWRDYQDVAVLAFPTPVGERQNSLKPASVISSPADEAWSQWLAGKDVKIQIPDGTKPALVDFTFDQPVSLRSIELPPIEHLMKRVSFDPDSKITISVREGGGWKELITHTVPRGNWQDRQPEVPLVLAVPDAKSRQYRIVFLNNRPMEISQLRFSAAARVQDWRAQAGYALRSLERSETPQQARETWVEQKSLIDLSDKLDRSGRLTWDVPDGSWTVVRFGHVNTGVKNKPAPPEATGFECDKLSTAGADQHFAGYIGRLAKDGGAADRGRLKGMLIDSWECYTQTWTPAMEEEFEKRRGYALRPWLPALRGWVVNDHRDSERFLRDWRATISDLIVENYYGRLAELGRQSGLELSFETSVGDVSPGDILQYFKSADVPMCEMWQPNDPHDGGLETKPIATTASAAHLYSKPRVACEAFTCAPLNWREHPFALKNAADRTFALGVTHLVFHTYTHNPLDRVPGTSFGSAIGTPFLRGQTWWQHMPHFVDYLARCSFMLEQGQSVADVLWYLGDDVDHKPRQDSPFPSGYHFDYLNADALLSRLSVEDEDLIVANGSRWRVLWLPREQCRRLTPKTLTKIKELLNAGATVIGEAPDLNPSLSGGAAGDQAFDALIQSLWGTAESSSGDQPVGKGRLLWGGDLKTSLAKLDLLPDVDGTLPEKWSHRRTEDADIYFVIGGRNQSLDANLHFRATGKPEFWDPIDGSIKPVSVCKQTETCTTIPIRLPVAGSTFVVFRSPHKVPKSAPPTTKPWQRISLDGQSLQDATNLSRSDTAAGFPKFGISRTEPIQPWVAPDSLDFELRDGGQKLVAWTNGQFVLNRAKGEPFTATVTGARSIPLLNDWMLLLPDGWDTPKSIKLGRVGPWSALEEKNTRHFSGTATYRKTFTFEGLEDDQRLMLDLGRVGNIADVRLNAKAAGVLWAAPYRKDITEFVRPGENVVEISVTNTWHNRLAYDQSQPKANRKTWTIKPPPANATLEFSGLESVHLHFGKVVQLPVP